MPDELAGAKLQFDLDDAVALLTAERNEDFPQERAIRLFQLQTWIWYPGSAASAEDAGKLAASTILSDLEDQIIPQMGRENMPMKRFSVLSESDEYRKLFDAVIAPNRGWSSVIRRAFRSESFDQRITHRSRNGPMIADLIDYRLRAVLNRRAVDEANISHAVFFNCWPKGKRTYRTYFEHWRWLKKTSGFIFLIEKHGYHMRPPKLDDDNFLESLLNPPMSNAKLRSFFSEYAFIIEQLNDADLVSITAKPLRFSVNPFSTDEIAIIDSYKANYDQVRAGAKDADDAAVELPAGDTNF